MNKDSAKSQYLEYTGSETGYRAYNDFKVCLYGENDALVQKIYKEVLFPTLKVHTSGTFRLCDIGGGDGKRILSLMKKASEDFPQIQFGLEFIEPSRYAIKEAKKTLEGSGYFTEIRLQEATLEKSRLAEKHFDFVLLIHSIFTLKESESIKKVFLSKKEDGKVLIVVNSDNTLMNKLNAELHKDFYIKRYELDSLLGDLDKLSIKYLYEEKKSKFHVKEINFPRFAKTILSWSSMGGYLNWSNEKKLEYDGLLKTLAEKNYGGIYEYREDEIFIHLE